jgi:amino acid permease
MIEVPKSQYRLPFLLIRILAYLMAGTIFIQALGCLAAYLLMIDSQAAGMLAHLLMQNLSYYFLGCTFIILSLSNLLIKRGISQLKRVRWPLLILVVSVATASFLLIPRIDHLRETALEDGMPVMLSPFANYFVILNSIVFLLLCAQIFCGALVAWRLARDGIGSGATSST